MNLVRVEYRLAGTRRALNNARTTRLVSNTIRKTLSIFSRREFVIDCYICDDKFITRINGLVYRRNRATDVITLRYPSKIGGPDGEFYLNAEIGLRESRARGIPFESELLFYAAHASLHFLGFDDSTPASRELMFNMQRKLTCKCLRGSKVLVCRRTAKRLRV